MENHDGGNTKLIAGLGTVAIAAIGLLAKWWVWRASPWREKSAALLAEAAAKIKIHQREWQDYQGQTNNALAYEALLRNHKEFFDLMSRTTRFLGLHGDILEKKTLIAAKLTGEHLRPLKPQHILGVTYEQPTASEKRLVERQFEILNEIVLELSDRNDQRKLR